MNPAWPLSATNQDTHVSLDVIASGIVGTYKWTLHYYSKPRVYSGPAGDKNVSEVTKCWPPEVCVQVKEEREHKNPNAVKNAPVYNAPTRFQKEFRFVFFSFF